MSEARWDRYPDRASARRAAARALHPDRGGDADAFVAALACVDAHFRPPPVLVRVGGRRKRRPAFVTYPLQFVTRRFGVRRPRRRRYIQL